MKFLRLILLSLCIIALLCCGTLTISAQTQKGAIAGIVSDEAGTLPSVNVTVKGTYFGAATDFNGKFVIGGMNPGSYIVDVSLIGYNTVEYSAVKVTAGDTTRLVIKMEQAVLGMSEMVIHGDKPLFDQGETQSTHSFSQEEIKISAVKNVQDVVSMQAGVVQEDNEIHIRGGRAYENAYLVDGVSVQDPLAGMGFGLQLPPSAIQEAEVLTGGYNAEYGQATSGIVNITTKEGQSKFSGSFSHKDDHLDVTSFNTDEYAGTLSGPFPLDRYLGLSDSSTMSFFTTLSVNLTDGYTRWVPEITSSGRPSNVFELIEPHQLQSAIVTHDEFFAPRRANVWSWLSKVSWHPTSTIKIAYSYTQSLNIDQNTQTVAATLDYVEPNPGFQYEFMYKPDSADTYAQKNFQHSITLTHTLSSKAFYEIRLSNYTAHIRGDANGKYYTAYTQARDIVTPPLSYYHQNTDTIGVIPGDGFYDVGNASEWTDHYLSEYTFKADLTYLFTEKNKFKGGFEHRYQDMQMVDIISPWYKPLGLNNDIYRAFPSQGDFYAQDNVTLKGMILNYGLRYDYWFPGKFVDDILAQPSDSINVPPGIQKAYMNETGSLFGRRFKARLSPRLGISHPVSDNQTLFFSYGHFSKLPRPQFVYSKLGSTTALSSLQTVGNPDLNPETTVSYELGLRNQFGESDVLTVTAYYKDIFDYITAVTVKATDARSGSYTTYVNQDYSRVRGIEVEYKTRLGKALTATLSGSYSLATGKSSNADEQIYNIQQGLGENIREYPMSFDRPLQLSANLGIVTKKGEPLFGFAKGILDDYTAFFRIFFESGMRYTRQTLYAYDPLNGRPEYLPDYNNPYSEVGANWFYVDFNFVKSFDLRFGTLALTIEIKNIFNNKNSQIINPVTGKAFEYGDHTQYPSPIVNDPLYPDLTPPVTPYPYNPARYLTPRTALIGLSFSF